MFYVFLLISCLILSSQNKSGNIKKAFAYFLVFVFFSFKHPFYLSVTNLKYNLKSSKLEGSIKLFTNDFEKALKNEFKQQVDLLHPKDKEQTLKWIEQYINRHLSITGQAQKLSIKVLGFENEEEAIWTYVETNEFKQAENLEIDCSFLLEQLPEQSNIIELEVLGQNQNYKLSKAEQRHLFVFK